MIYMYNFFKTPINFDILKIEWNNDFLKHLTNDEYGLRICPFGQIAIIFLVAIHAT